MKPTAFQTAVYRVVSRIPPGRVASYKQVAAALKCGSARAVGQALRCNPFAPQVPCHRVIAADLSPGGFQGAAAGSTVKNKLNLLAKEGVRFVNGRLADPGRMLEGSFFWTRD